MNLQTDFYPDSKFGDWFIRSNIWSKYVLRETISSLRGLYKSIPAKSKPVILDAGCGYGHSFKYLIRFFNPGEILAIDIDPKVIRVAQIEARKFITPVKVETGDCSRLPYETASVDIIFCHQTLHHLLDQESALKEYARVLKADGILVMAESTKLFIQSFIIDLLFRHPNASQRTKDEYLELIKNAGFDTNLAAIETPFPWWTKNPVAKRNREPLLYMVAPKSQAGNQ
ncbi:class I SAM-dependent methyltransferase [Polynucleobacter sp.]|jgi:ubiquinone/menaquinone biosynthesis C-methylase UbiE|uniref:class I SAM-dependent methyltransferase n=1 Tax=Polynucleobacter sp. TaxID=2029855 RepID=UPI0037CC6371